MSSNVKLIALSILFICCNELHSQEGKYFCPPCPNDCDTERYEYPGICPTCGMTLEKETAPESFEGYMMLPIKIESGDITLNAAYYSPTQGTTTNAAVVIVHGSAPSTFDDVAYYTSIATKLGMSILAFDKRGCGESGGTYQYFTVEGSKAWFTLLAQDVSVCLNWLKNQSEIDSQKIGLLGGSQAGWIMPLVASTDTTVNFIISGEGATVSAGEENFHSELTGDGSGNGISINEADKKLKMFDGERGFDPRNILKILNVKTLWFFGTKDDVIPVNASIEVLNKINNENFEIITLPNGDHNFMNVETETRYDLTKYIKPWLVEIGVLN